MPNRKDRNQQGSRQQGGAGGQDRQPQQQGDKSHQPNQVDRDRQQKSDRKGQREMDRKP